MALALFGLAGSVVMLGYALFAGIKHQVGSLLLLAVGYALDSVVCVTNVILDCAAHSDLDPSARNALVRFIFGARVECEIPAQLLVTTVFIVLFLSEPKRGSKRA